MPASGQVLSWFARPEPFFRKWFILAFSFPNLVALPLVMVKSICMQKYDELGYDTVEDCGEDGSVYILLFSLSTNLGLWVFAYEWTNGDVDGDAKSAADLESQLSNPTLDDTLNKKFIDNSVDKSAERNEDSCVIVAVMYLKRAFGKPSVIGQ